MPVYGGEGESARKNFFVVTAYRFEPGAEPTPDLPSTGPCREWDGEPCRIKPHHLRDRKTGPRFSLTVVQCKTHRRAFTLYPHGHVPYGRRAIAPVGPDGSPLADPAPQRRGESRARRFAHTYFDAALDAAEGRAWPRPPAGDGGPSWGVQGRHLHRSTDWLGVAPASPPRRTETLATALGVDTLLVTEQKKKIAGDPGYRSRGRAVCSVLAVLAKTLAVAADRLTAAGYAAGLWGPPFRWDLPPGALRPLALGLRSGAPPVRGP